MLRDPPLAKGNTATTLPPALAGLITLFNDTYLAAYARHRPPPPDLLTAWLGPLAAARRHEHIPGEAPPPARLPPHRPGRRAPTPQNPINPRRILEDRDQPMKHRGQRSGTESSPHEI